MDTCDINIIQTKQYSFVINIQTNEFMCKAFFYQDSLTQLPWYLCYKSWCDVAIVCVMNTIDSNLKFEL